MATPSTITEDVPDGKGGVQPGAAKGKYSKFGTAGAHVANSMRRKCTAVAAVTEAGRMGVRCSAASPPYMSPFAVPPWPVRKFTVAEYHQMIQAGILTENDTVELIEGWIVPKMPHNPPHDATVDQARELLQTSLPPGWRVRIQSAITTAESEPEPDLVVTPGPASRYAARHPQPHEIALVAEVSDSSLFLRSG